MRLRCVQRCQCQKFPLCVIYQPLLLISPEEWAVVGLNRQMGWRGACTGDLGWGRVSAMKQNVSIQAMIIADPIDQRWGEFFWGGELRAKGGFCTKNEEESRKQLAEIILRGLLEAGVV